MLVSVITPDIIGKRNSKEIKKAEAQAFIEQKKIPSYIEIRLDNKKNVSLLDRHLRYIINPYVE
jgi:hypothetical protein